MLKNKEGNLKGRVNEEDRSITFILDTIRQLKSGMTCYAYKEWQVDAIRKEYKSRFDYDLKVEYDKENSNFIITPLIRLDKLTRY